MSDQYIGEIRMFAGNFAPKYWAFCDGSLLDVASNSSLFTLLGTTYGGDGIRNFGLPDLRGRAPIHRGMTMPLGQMSGAESVNLTVNNLPPHSHHMLATSQNANTRNPSGAIPAKSSASVYGEVVVIRGKESLIALAPDSITDTGDSHPHDNMMPFLVINFIIALEGVFPF
jgi:microcystin-dependent protein